MSNINATLQPDNPEASQESEQPKATVSLDGPHAVVQGSERVRTVFRITEEDEDRMTEEGEIRIIG